MQLTPGGGPETPAEAIKAHFDDLDPLPARLGVAVSGGGNSLALLHLLRDWGRAALTVYTVDHGLRPEAADEARQVAAQAAALGLGHRTLRWSWDGTGNLPEAAREGRYAALAAACAGDGIADCALGHTRDDNIETFFLGLMRGAGLDGLAGMRGAFARGGVTFHRPLLPISRSGLRDVLRARELTWFEDPGNDDPARDRARLRHALMVLDLPDAQVARSVAMLAASRRDVSDEMVRAMSGGFRSDGPDLVLALRGPDGGMSDEFWRRALSAALRAVSSAPHAPRAAQLMRLVRRDWRREPGPVTLAGCTIGFEPAGLRIGREPAAVPAPVPTTDPWDGRWRATGPHGPDTTLGALGEDGLRALSGDWKASTLPRRSMLAAPAVRRGGRVVHCPFGALARPEAAEQWDCTARDLVPAFTAAALSH